MPVQKLENDADEPSAQQPPKTSKLAMRRSRASKSVDKDKGGSFVMLTDISKYMSRVE